MNKYFRHRNSLIRYKRRMYKELIVNINYDRLSRFVKKEIRNDKRIWCCKYYNILTERNNGGSIANLYDTIRKKLEL